MTQNDKKNFFFQDNFLSLFVIDLFIYDKFKLIRDIMDIIFTMAL